ncbi:hypothetical protein TRFO_42431 [Tritrichomonas foetus]|uniref:Ubiquitin-like domain-containing protein n=1 Tax=Tritrichomonas foetus TaxID=1144522 RepID=A0A1J4L0X7_9EUKA|nr:hypothetical protein TRFO_42431 [Tritrichomonas foetus]|eukprot:OHT15612.1 hypothetical protein TRFO_42431 [Tritrichomonas foetus]
MNDVISVFLYDQADMPIKVTVSLDESVRVLDDVIKEKGTRLFFCNGKIILPAFSFHYLDIKDGDNIVVVRSREQKHLHDSLQGNKMASGQIDQRRNMKNGMNCHSKMASIIRIPNRDDSKHDGILDGSLFREASRLSDIIRTREENWKTHRFCDYAIDLDRAGDNTENIDGSQSIDIKNHTTFIGGSIKIPSSEALPLLWSTI